jgi:multiple sugar transport system permease protein
MTLALILNSKVRGARFLRSIMMIPWVVPTVIAALLWSWIFSSPYGLLKYLVNIASNGRIPNFAVLNSTSTALWGVAIVALWKQVPLITLLLLAGLQNVPDDIMEAAKVDGASSFIRLIKITIPYMKSVIKVSMTMCIIENFKHYPLFAALTNGGPSRATTSLAVLSYDEAFANFNYGSGAAVTTVWLLIMIAVVIVFNRIFKSEDMG